MSKRHYHVLCGLRGCYMPNYSMHHATRKSAQSDAVEWARQYRDDGVSVTGSARSGFYSVGEHESIEIHECREASCLEDCDNE